jgi:DNA-binding transcriptional MocR family regulator
MRISGISIDPRRKEPLHTQIFDQVVARIRSGAFPAGHRLLPTRALAEELGAHRNTVVRAYADLVAAGFVQSTVGRGTFVAPEPPAAPAAGSAESAGMPWASLLSRMASVEPLGRQGRLGRTLAEFLERGYMRAHLGRTLPEYRARRDALEAALREALPSSVRFRRPDRGVVLWLELPADLDAELVYEEAKRHGVLVSPGSLNAVDSRTQGGLRLTFCAELAPRLVEGGRRLGRAMRALTGGNKGKAVAPELEIV